MPFCKFTKIFLLSETAMPIPEAYRRQTCLIGYQYVMSVFVGSSPHTLLPDH